MEPNLNAPRLTPEQMPTLPSPEAYPGASIEARPEHEQTMERPASQELTQQPVAVPVLPQPVQPPVADEPAAAAPLSGVPTAAADDDLIEKEWVHKAKQIIAQTTDDPYRREEALTQLQREYLRKRYGKELGASS